MSDASRNIALGVFCAVAVFAGLRLVDLAHGLITFLLVQLGALPRASLAGSALILGVVALVALGAKALALIILAWRPDRLTWLARSWTWPIVLGVLAVVTSPLLRLLYTKQNLALASRELPIEIGNWFLATSYVSFATQLATAALWTAAVLLAFARLRSSIAPA